MKKFFRLIIFFMLSSIIMSCMPSQNIQDIFSNNDMANNITPSETMPVETPEDVIDIVETDVAETEPVETASETPTDREPTSTLLPEKLNATGPYILYGGQDGVWISNPDGRFLTHIFDEEYYNDLHKAVSPDSQHLALVTQSPEKINLILVDIPSGNQIVIAALLDGAIPDNTSPEAFISYAVLDYNSVAWSPDGRYLAFVGAIDGPTSDLYMYDMETFEITRFTDGGAQAILPVWSPDGKYILHYGVSWVPPFGGAIVGHNRLNGVWTVRIADGEVFGMPSPADIHVDYEGWYDDSHYLACDEGSLYKIHVETGQETEIIDCCCNINIVYAPENGRTFLNLKEGCNEDLGTGMFILPQGSDTPEKVVDFPSWEMHWSAESDAFYAYPDAAVLSDGSRVFLPPDPDQTFSIAISPLGYAAWKVIENTQTSVHFMDPDGNWVKEISVSVLTMLWDPVDATRLIMVTKGPHLMSITVPDFTVEMIDDFDGRVWEAIYVP